MCSLLRFLASLINFESRLRLGTNILNAVSYCSEETSLKVVIPRIEIHSGREKASRRATKREKERGRERRTVENLQLQIFSRKHERHVVNNSSYRPTKLLIYLDGVGARARVDRRRIHESETRLKFQFFINFIWRVESAENLEFFSTFVARRLTVISWNPLLLSMVCDVLT